MPALRIHRQLTDFPAPRPARCANATTNTIPILPTVRGISLTRFTARFFPGPASVPSRILRATAAAAAAAATAEAAAAATAATATTDGAQSVRHVASGTHPLVCPSTRLALLGSRAGALPRPALTSYLLSPLADHDEPLRHRRPGHVPGIHRTSPALAPRRTRERPLGFHALPRDRPREKNIRNRALIDERDDSIFLRGHASRARTNAV